MTTSPDWLRRLENALDYEALQQTFSQIVAEAQSGKESPELARAIDAAIKRLEEERANDERELQEIQGRYESFREENRGVMGWFKRHTPFTETRKHEKEHVHEVADQQAEILADNLVIARAQMIKERFLAPAERKLGRRPGDWQAELDRRHTVHELGGLAESLKAVAAEIDRSRGFVQLLKQDIEAFAGAQFNSKEDRQRRDADLATARAELADLQHELDQEAAIKQEGLQRLGKLVAEELTANDAAFRDDAHQLERLRAAAARFEEARAATAGLAAAVGTLGRLAKELHDLPADLQQLREKRKQIERQQSDAAIATARKAAVHDERRLRLDEAQRALQQRQQALDSVTQSEAAYRAAHQAEKSMPQMVEAGGDDSPYAGQLQAAQAALDAAQASVAQVQPGCDAAKCEVDDAQRALAAIDTQLKEAGDKLAAMEHRGPQLRRELSSAADAGHAAFAAAATALAAYLRGDAIAGAAQSLRTEVTGPVVAGWIGMHGLERPFADALFHADRDYQQHVQANAVLERLTRWEESHRQALEGERAAIAQRREHAWKRRCRELLGDGLTEEARRHATL
ncbi:MAG TPA: hypothetical protein VGX76_07005 [Pirellulales bacterium]|nr:hypothetical protein [Pirellulales bacterium]